MTSHGCRPISVTIHAASVAIHPEKVNPANTHRSQRGGIACFLMRHAPNHASAIINKPTPTMIRNAKKIGATGGVSGAKASRPFTSPSRLWVRIRLARFGIAIS